VNQTGHGGQNNWCETLYDAKAAELILYGRALGLSHGEAEDVVQETFLALMQLDFAPAKPEHYCVRSFRNRALNHRRSLWRRLTREWEALAGGHFFADSHQWFEKSPDETGRVLQENAVRVLAELPLEQREVIVLKIWHDCTFEEIAGLLEISPNTAAGRYRYGIQKIKVKLEANVEGLIYERNEFAAERFTGGTASILATAPAGGGA
jgi:RNA polymerase sigma-70 factor (ECF subfamily)